MSFINTQYFREAALYYKKHGRYADGDYGSYECIDYWSREEERVIEGYSVGGVKITGEHYLYLNYLPILVNKAALDSDILVKEHLIKGKVKGDRGDGFADFWDSDYALFWTWDIAKNGIEGNTIEEKLVNLKKIEKHLSIPVIKTFDNLNGGKNHLWLKPRGVGAEQPLTEVLITPTGEITMGDVKIGTELYDRSGNITKVTEILPQGYKEVWKVKLLDGREVECGEKHLWTVETRIRKGKPEYKTLTTKQILDNGLVYNHSTGQKTYKYKIPELQPVQFKEKSLPIPPYVLGALLGDGTINGKNIKIASDDIEIVNKIINDLNKVWVNSYEAAKDTSNNNYIIKLKDRNEYLGINKELYGENVKFGCNPLKREIELLGVNKKCDKKFIPEIYKYSSIEQRLELVKGLMDTDGSISEQGYCEFTNTCEQLIDDLAYILRGLGIYCSKGISDRGINQTIIGSTGRISSFIENPYFRLYIATNTNIFNLKRKSGRINYKKRTKTSCPIINIENTKVLVRQQCIMVDNKEQLYLTKDFIITHNSWKGAAKAVRNQFFIKDSTTFFVAGEKKYLTDEGLYSKYLYHRNSLLGENKNGGVRCGGFRRSFSKQDITNMNFKAAKVEEREVDGQKQLVEVGGKRSSVIGLSINGKPDNIRGKRGDIIYEEFGTFPVVARTWSVAQQSVEQEGIVFNNQYGFGTGGDDKAVNIRDLDIMFNNPQGYNILEFENIFDEELYGMKMGYFTPATMSITYIDKDGNTDEQACNDNYIQPTRDILEKNPDPQAYTQFCAEKPRKPSEALMTIKGNIFPVKELKAHKTRIMGSGLHNDVVVKGRLEEENGKIIFVKSPPTDKLFDLFPIPRGTTADSPIGVIHPPFKSSGKVPDNMYRICVDPYRHDSSEGDSIGSCYVIENPNRLTDYKGDKIVAWYNARPESQEDFNKTIYNLAVYYNAKIGFENDEPGDIVGYGKRNKLLSFLEEEFELAYDERIKTKSTSTKSYGMHIASGKDNLRKLQGDMYIKQWLNTVRHITEDGRQIKNLHFIYDIGLLEELIKYNPTDNFDRISSFRIGMYYERELLYKGKTVGIKKKITDPFLKNGLRIKAA